MADIVIVGAGLAGLCCARVLHQRGVPFQILEASEDVGGRIKTDIVDGFRLDRGFQVFLTSYPEAAQVLDYEALQLRPFLPGALIRTEQGFTELTDPWRRPWAGMWSLASPVGTLIDKLRIAALRRRVLRGQPNDCLRAPETTTREALERAGFTPVMIEQFFRPFFGGIFLEEKLQTSSRMMNYLFRMFSIGDATLPAQGMQAIPRQIAAGLPPGSVRYGARVREVRPDQIVLDDGEPIDARAVVIATDGPAARRLLGDQIASKGRGTTVLYFVAPDPPLNLPLLVLNGQQRGPINTLCIPTVVAPEYGPGDRSLVSVSVLGTDYAPRELETAVRSQLSEWFGHAAHNWPLLQLQSIPYALPDQVPPALENPERPVRLQRGLYVCGDHRDQGSIQGAMVSGRRAAEALLADLQR